MKKSIPGLLCLRKAHLGRADIRLTDSSGRFLNQLPGAPDVLAFRVSLSNTESESEPSIEDGMSQVNPSGLIEPLEQLAIEGIARAMRKADQVQRGRSAQFEMR